MPSTSQSNSGLWSGVAKLGDWVATRVKNIDIFDEHHQLEAKTNPFYALGPIFYLIWFVTMATGLVLIMWYVPSKAVAFDSILTIQTQIPFGNLMRGVHKYGADAMIIAATIRVFRMFINADYKPGKEFNVAIALVTLLLSMYSGLTGYLLIWNQRAFWATKVFATFPTYMDQFPIMGDYYAPLVKSLHLGWNTAEVLLGAGGAITQETITRFFSLHLAFSLIPLILVEIYFYNNNYKRMPLSWVKRNIVMLMLLITAIILPAAQGRRSDPDVTPLPILSDWSFLGLYQMYKYLEPVVATEITMVIPITVVLLPFLDSWITGAEKDIMKRPFILMTTIMGGLSWIIFSLLIIANIANIHEDPPFWRSFLYLTVDIGIVWQLFIILTNKDVKARAKAAVPALIMAAIGISQTFWAWVYFYMAQTEMFLSPLGHGAIYGLCRPFMGDAGPQLEELIRKVVPKGAQMPYNIDFVDAVTARWAPKVDGGAEIVNQINQVKGHEVFLDFIFKWIPTFTPTTHAQYDGMMDFMICNKWAFDYVTLMDRLTPAVEAKYPLPVPNVDWWWMIGGLLTTLLAVYVFIWSKGGGSKPNSTPSVKPTPQSTDK
ncbi:MAG: cytochrome b N-terminal domain-containing protein [Candidatus Obscuribacterales bacterium]|nr:cytochrome b N-terminal domain-containing protein [Candidatus Obscuribacterales bacterium]